MLVELIHRIARRARTGDFTQLDQAEKGDVLQATNAAMQKCYNLLPIYFKEMTVSFLLPAPLTVTLTVTSGSNVVAGTPFSTSQVGCTVSIPGDASYNQIIGPSLLQNPYIGTSGTVIATVYGDTVYSNRYPFDRMVAGPWFADQSQLPLIRRSMNLFNAPYGGITPSVGRPTNWWVEPFGNSQGNNPIIFLRLWPLPDQAYVIKTRLAFWPQRLLLADYIANTIIAVPDQFLDTALVPLGVRALMDTPAFQSRNDEQTLKESAMDAENFLKLQPAAVAAPSNSIGTPLGF